MSEPRAAEQRGSGFDRAGEPSAWPKYAPADAGMAKLKERGATEGGYWHPPLPPQERFQEWGKLRAPVRGAERPPSLFERVTATFRKEREGAPVSPPALAEGGDTALATAEEETYDIPAFLRR